MKDYDEKQKKKRKIKYVSSNNDTDEEGVEQLEALLVRRFHRSKGKFKCKLPIIYFNYDKVGHIAARYTHKQKCRGGDKYKSRRDDDKKGYKDKGKKSC